MSEFQIEVVQLGPIRKHENADSLSITDVYGGYPCIIKTGTFNEGDKAVYIPVDALVPVAHPDFAFLSKEAKSDGFARIKARRLRGTFSMGLLIPAPEGTKVGENLQEFYGIKKYLPPADMDEEENNTTKKPWPWWKKTAHRYLPKWCFPKKKKEVFQCPVYDIDGLRKFKTLLLEDTEVTISEKIHGSNCRYVYTKGTLFRTGKLRIGSHKTWGRNLESYWGRVAIQYNIEQMLKNLPGKVLYGEVYGDRVQDLNYGLTNGKIAFAVFDLYDTVTKQYMPYGQLCTLCWHYGIPMVPELYRGPWKPELVSLAEGKTTLNNAEHVREGIVIKTIEGRTILKLHGEGYLTRKENNV